MYVRTYTHIICTFLYVYLRPHLYVFDAIINVTTSNYFITEIFLYVYVCIYTYIHPVIYTHDWQGVRSLINYLCKTHLASNTSTYLFHKVYQDNFTTEVSLLRKYVHMYIAICTLSLYIHLGTIEVVLLPIISFYELQS